MKIVSDICIFVNKYFCCCFSKGEKVRPQNDPSQLGGNAKSNEELSKAITTPFVVGKLQPLPSITGSGANENQDIFPQSAPQNTGQNQLQSRNEFTANEQDPETKNESDNESQSPRTKKYLESFGLRNKHE